MRIFDDKQVENYLLRMLKSGETLKCGVLAKIVPSFKELLINQVLRAGIGSMGTYCIFGIGGRKFLFSILDSELNTTGKITIDFNEISKVKIRRGIFGRYIICLKDNNKDSLKISVSGVALGSKITKQKEMRDTLIREISNEFILKK